MLFRSTHLDVDILKDTDGKRALKTCVYKWKIYSEGFDKFDVRTEKQFGQPIVFRRDYFLTSHEVESLYPTPEPIPEQQKIEFEKTQGVPF